MYNTFIHEMLQSRYFYLELYMVKPMTQNATTNKDKHVCDL